MYYEEKFDGGILWFRTTPGGPWNPVESRFGAAAAKFAQLSDDERLRLISMTCRGCGVLDPRCQCWNDD
jgi:hypothetical protein